MNPFIQDKAQEISFAVLRIAAYIRRFDLRKKIENLAYHLIENVYYQNEELSLATINTITGFITLGTNVYEIENVNAKILLEQLEILKVELNKVAGLEPINRLESFFKAVPSPSNSKTNDKKDITEKSQNVLNNSFFGKDQNNTAIGQSGKTNQAIIQSDKIRQENPSTIRSGWTQAGTANIDGNIIKAVVRQNSILEAIRQNQNKRLQLRDLINQFPDISERTIRYDLKILCDQGRLVRQGQGGPSNFYQTSQG